MTKFIADQSALLLCSSSFSSSPPPPAWHTPSAPPLPRHSLYSAYVHMYGQIVGSPWLLEG